MVNPNNDNVHELITKHLAGETSADEESTILLWLNQSEENKRHFASLKKAFELSTRHVAMPESENLNIDVDREWKSFQEKVGTSARKRVRHLSPLQMGLRVAASLLLIVVTGAIVYYILKPIETVCVTQERTQTFTLPDGSIATLNRYSRLSYDEDFGDQSRMLKLKGEAFFDVKPDVKKPFIIVSGNARVQVIGTTFNVMAYDSLESVEVVVETGIVSLEPVTGGNNRVEILPGERGIIAKSDQRISIVVNEDVNFRSWSTRHLVFVDDDLLSVIRTLERTYNATITIHGEVPASCIVTVTFDQQSLESVMRVLENTLNLKYTINGNKVEITEAGC